MASGIKQSSDAKPDKNVESMLGLKSQSLGPPESGKQDDVKQPSKSHDKSSASDAPKSDATSAKAKSKSKSSGKRKSRIVSDQIKTDGNQITFDLSPQSGDTIDDKIKELQQERDQLRKQKQKNQKDLKLQHKANVRRRRACKNITDDQLVEEMRARVQKRTSDSTSSAK